VILSYSDIELQVQAVQLELSSAFIPAVQVASNLWFSGVKRLSLFDQLAI